MISRENIHDLVSIFYRPTFKTFYVNSLDGVNMKKPYGVFVSLGMTTSLETLNNIKDIISDSKDYNAVLAEISSRRVGNQFINTLTNTKNPEQYRLKSPDSGLFDETGAKKELERLKGLMNPGSSLETLEEYAPKVTRLQYLIDKLDESGGWSAHNIQLSGSEYRIYHLFVNYEKRDDGLEYRLGIFVDEKEKHSDSSTDSISS